jgi:hypothetical protein
MMSTHDISDFRSSLQRWISQLESRDVTNELSQLNSDRTKVSTWNPSSVYVHSELLKMFGHIASQWRRVCANLRE